MPLSVRKGRLLAKRLGVPFRTLDIDRPAEERAADRLVRGHGDDAPDYLIPQVFLEWSDGAVQHLLTGFSEKVARTSDAWDALLASEWLRSVVREGSR